MAVLPSICPGLLARAAREAIRRNGLPFAIGDTWRYVRERCGPKGFRFAPGAWFTIASSKRLPPLP